MISLKVNVLFCCFVLYIYLWKRIDAFFCKKHPLLEYILLMTILTGRINFVRKV